MHRTATIACLLGLGCSAAMSQEPRPVVVVESSYCPVLVPLHFDLGKADLVDARDFIDTSAHVIMTGDLVRLLEIAGHASDDEPAAVAQARADATLEALVARGVPRSRLRARGYGNLCPIETGDGAEARARNRRVELKVVVGRDGPTGVELGCPNAAGAATR